MLRFLVVGVVVVVVVFIVVVVVVVVEVLIELDCAMQVEVKEPPQGVLPPSHNVTARSNTSPVNRLRQYRSRTSAGLRVRAQPSLQGEQIGIVAVDATISFIEEVLHLINTWTPDSWRLSAILKDFFFSYL